MNQENHALFTPHVRSITNLSSVEVVESVKADTELKQTSPWLRYATLAVFSAVITGFGMCESLFAPFFPTEAERRGISSTTVGFIFGTFPFVMFVGSLVSGPLVRKLGPFFMIWSGTLLAGGSLVLFGVLDYAPVNASYVILCFALRLVEGIGASLYNTAVFSVVTVMFPTSISTVYAVLETAVCTGMIIGPSLGGWLFKVGGFGLPFYVVGGLLLLFGTISTIFLTITIRQSKKKSKKNVQTGDGAPLPSHERRKLSMADEVALFMTSFDVWVLIGIIVVSSLVLQFPEPILALYLETLGMTDPFEVGLVFLASALSYTVFSLSFGKLADLYPKTVPPVCFKNSHIFSRSIQSFQYSVDDAHWVCTVFTWITANRTNTSR